MVGMGWRLAPGPDNVQLGRMIGTFNSLAAAKKHERAIQFPKRQH
jgi:hypothetical protein